LETIMSQPQHVKMIGANGQISLGKQYAGRTVLVEEQAPGVWLIRTATLIPDNEQWLHEAQTKASLERAMTWTERQAPSDETTESLLKQWTHGQD
jgi:hypothetical protein